MNPNYATNLVRNGQGFSPVLFTDRRERQPRRRRPGSAATVRAELSDPFEIGLSLKFEYFNIGSEYNAIMGARREADVLLTDGIITGGFTRGGQLPTLNVANEFQDWDEPWYETVYRLARRHRACSSTCCGSAQGSPASTPTSATTPTCRTGTR